MAKELRIALLLAALAGPLAAQVQEVRVQEARALAGDGRYDEAKRLLGPRTRDPEALHLLSRIAMLQADDEAAAELCRKAVELRPASAEYHYCLGNATRSVVQHASLFRKPALSKEARGELLRALELDPDHLRARIALLHFYLYAPAIGGGSEEKALEQAVEIGKRDRVRGHLARARIHAKHERVDLVRQELLDAVREAPGSARAHSALGTHYATEAKNYAAALDELETAVRVEPAYMPAWFRLGQAVALGAPNLARGEEALERYVAYRPQEDEPGLGTAHYYLGVVQEKQGKTAEARRSYAAALRYDPSSKPAREALARLR